MGSSKIKTTLGFILFLFWVVFMMLLASISNKRQNITEIHQDLHQVVPKQFLLQHPPRPSSESSASSSIKTTPVTDHPTSKTTIATTVYHESLPAVSWVPLWSENTSQLWGERAYIDDRANVHRDPVVVLIGFKESRAEKVRNGYRWFCHITYSKNVTPVCTGLANIDQLEYQFANSHGWSLPSFFICPLKRSLVDDHPLAVALSVNSCDSKLHSHLIPITSTSQPLKTVGICLHKALFGLTDPQLIIQFIEAHKFFGVSLFTIYIQEVSDGVRDILYSYSQEGIVDVVEWRINITMDVRDYGQVGLIHDCLYRNKNRVKFLGFLDIDELFVPKNPRKHLAEVLEQADKPHFGSFRFSHVFMHNSSYNSSLLELVQCPKVHVPVYFRRYKRSNYDDSVGIYDKLGSKTKIFVKPNAIIRMGRHSMRLRPIHKFAPGFSEFPIPGHMGLLFHYRHIIQGKYERRPLVKDLTMSEFRTTLMDTINSKLCVS